MLRNVHIGGWRKFPVEFREFRLQSILFKIGIIKDNDNTTVKKFSYRSLEKILFEFREPKLHSILFKTAVITGNDNIDVKKFSYNSLERNCGY